MKKMNRTARVRARVAAVWMFAACFAWLCGPAVRGADDQVPEEDRASIEALLKKKIAALLEEKDAKGLPYKRGAYSRLFHRLAPDTYQVTFYQDTIRSSASEGPTLQTERYRLTVKKAGTDWTIANQELEDTYAGLYRPYYDMGEIYRFEKLRFEREGFLIKGSNGRLFKLYHAGKTVGLVAAADDLSYDYNPPKDAGYYPLVRQRWLRQYPQDFMFRPERLEVLCDPKTCEALLAEAFVGLARSSGGGGGERVLSRFGPRDSFSQLGDRLLGDTFDDFVAEIEKRLRENPFGGFALPFDPERVFWSFDLKKAGKDHWFTIRYDTWEPWEVAVYVTGYGRFGPFPTVYGPRYGIPVFAYHGEATRRSQAASYELEKRPDFDARDYELHSLKGTVSLALADPETVEGDITYGFTIKRNLRELPFAISRIRFDTERKDIKNPKMFINALQDGEGNDLTYVKTGAFSGMVVFPKTIPAGTKLTLRLQFTNRDSIYVYNPTYSYVDRGGWLPFVQFADLIDELDVTLKVPEKYRVLGIGRKVSEEVKGGVRTSRWVADYPVSFPSVTFGDYIEDGPGDEVKPTKSDGTPIAVRVYVDKTSTQIIGTRAEFTGGAREIRGSQLRAIAVQAGVALEIYKKIYGVDYPFAKLDLVADPFGFLYGQSPSSLIYLGFGVFRGEGELGVYGGADVSKFLKDVVAHEVAHQWWGSLIANANSRNYWFVESLAEFSSALYVEEVFGRKRYLEKVADWRRFILDTEQVSTVQNSYEVWAGENGFGSVVANIYNKGPYAFHELRELCRALHGEKEGDAKFFAFLKELAGTLKGKEIVTRDIQMVAEKALGLNLETFFDQWLRGIGLPQYAIFYTIRATEDGKWLVEGKIRQRVLFGKFKEEMPGVYYGAFGRLTFVSQKGKEFKSPYFLVNGPETPFKFKVPEEPVEVAFNKDGEILAHEVLVNRSW